MLMAAVVLMLAACGDERWRDYEPEYAPAPAESRAEYVFGIHPQRNPEKLHAVFGPLIDYLNEQLPDARIVFEASRNYDVFDQRIVARQFAFVLPNPYETLLAIDKGYRVFAKMGNDADLRGLIVVRRDSGIDSVDDLKEAPADIFRLGGEGGLELAEKTVRIIAAAPGNYRSIYDWNLPVEDKIFKVASEIYGAVSIDYQPQARRNLDLIKKIGYGNLPVCIAKTQQSLSDNPSLLGLPKNFIVTVREIKIASGAGFLIPITGEILRMPGLSKVPAAYNINIDNNGIITGIV